MKVKLADNKEAQVSDMKSYYRFQAKIYDATRWTFLYGRKSILDRLPFDKSSHIKILEVGCGTGVNLRHLAKKYPHAELTGMDVSGDMLDRAAENLSEYKNRLQLLEKPYEKGTEFNGMFDLILFSYCLTMVNPQWLELVEQVPLDLKPEGLIAVVDFHNANFEFYRKFMRSNHVKLDGHILPVLEQDFDTVYKTVKPGMAGVWSYMMFIGRKKKI